ncbi:MAG: ribulokinase [SAR324 cluster bacterium]|nr:ribulokinase [SAR324 cluster bacterium]
MKSYTIGLDFGTNSVRSIIADCSNGDEIATSVFNYPTGEHGVILDKDNHHLARQNPADYIEGLESSVIDALKDAHAFAGFSNERVIGIGVDTTGSTPMPVGKNNSPLAISSVWKNNPAAHAWLWKDHTAAEEAQQITRLARKHRPQYLAKCGGIYSSEWFWSKIWHCLNSAPDVFDAAYSWLEIADYIPALLAGIRDPHLVIRGICPAGHKAMYCDEWEGLPDKEFLAMLNPKLADLRDRLYLKAHSADFKAGELSAEWANKLGLIEGIPIGVGALDAHYGAIGAGVKEGTLVKIIGTSTCDCTVAPTTKKVEDVPGICGIVNGSILPGFYGLEAGQSAVGDIFKWFVEIICQGNDGHHQILTEEASGLHPGQSGLLALDWNNGNRTILVDPKLSGLLIGQTLYTTSAEIYRALIEATAFGARAIIDRFQEFKIPVEKIVCCGGIAEKNPLLMQIYADVTGCTMQVSASEQTCALGSAIVASVLAGELKGGHPSIFVAQQKMTQIKSREYFPNLENKVIYDKLYRLYCTLHDGFGGVQPMVDLSNVMKDLMSLKKG